MASRKKRMKYIRDIPVPIRQQICDIFDDLSGIRTWRQLAGLLGFKSDEIAHFQLCMQRPGGSPTDEMLTTWDYENHTIEELFTKLSEIKHVRCMELLKDLVDPTLHCLIAEARGNSQPQVREPSLYQPGASAPGHPHQPPPNIPLPSHNQENNFGRSYSPQPQRQHPAYSPLQQPLPHQLHNIAPTAPHLPLPPVDRSKMTTPIAGGGSTTSNNMSPQLSHNKWNHPLQQQNGNRPSRQPSEHPLGGPERYISQCSKQDNFAPPPVPSPESLSSCRPPVFQAVPPAPANQADSVEQYLSSTIEVPFMELLKATNNFSDENKLGEGSFGTVYFGKLNMTEVAIKLIKKNDNVFYDQSKIRRDQIKEILALTKYRHPNIVSLTSYSSDGEDLCLILAYMRNGSLESNLEGKSKHGPLGWMRRLSIAEGAAKGIHYLHTAQATPLIHQDIKSANILLDENFVAKIADFGLARPGPSDGKEYTTIKTSVVFGTKAYLAPEFRSDLKRKLSTRLDVYSFGVVLMEIVTGTKAGASKDRLKVDQLLTNCVDKIMDKHEKSPRTVVELLLDPTCPDWPHQNVMEVLRLASRCTEDFKRRPEMREVVETLQDIIRMSENVLGNPSRRNVDPIENTEPLPYREGEESFYRSDSSDGMMPGGAMAPAQRVNGYPERIYPNERKVPNPYGGFEALNEGLQRRREMENEIRAYRKDIEPATCSSSSAHVQNLRAMQNADRHGGYIYPGGYSQQMGGAAGYDYGYPSATSSAAGTGRYPPAQQTPNAMAPSPGPSYPSYPYYSDIQSGASFDDGQLGGNSSMHPAAQYAYQQQMYDPRGPDYRYQMMDGHLGHPGIYPEDTTPYRSMMPLQMGVQAGPGMRGPVPPREEHHRYYHGANADLLEKGINSTDNLVSGMMVKGTEPQHARVVTSTSSDQSSTSSPTPRYPKMPTISLGKLSIESSDTSNLTSDTSLRTSSEEGSGMGEVQRSEACALKTDNICDSGRSVAAQNGVEGGMANGIDRENQKGTHSEH